MRTVISCKVAGRAATSGTRSSPSVDDGEALRQTAVVSRRESFLRALFAVGLLPASLPPVSVASTTVTSIAGRGSSFADEPSLSSEPITHGGTNTAASRCGNAPPPRRVAVVGADGRTGKLVVQELLKAGVEVLATVRNPSRAAGLRQPGVEVVLLDVTGKTGDMATSLKGADAIICCLGFRPTYVPSEDQRLAQEVDSLGVCKLVDAAVHAGVPRFVLLSSLLTAAPQDDPSYRALNMLGGVLAAKHASEVYLTASPLQYTIIRSGVFAADAQGPVRIAPEDSITSFSGPPSVVNFPADSPNTPSCSSPLAVGSSRGGALCAVSRAQVAKVCVSALFEPAACRRTVELFATANATETDASKLW